MNIHFSDKSLFNKLCDATIAKVKVGSHMYGTNNEFSDIDYLYIYATSENELNSFIKVHHQLQFKEDGIDYNFVSLHTFLNNTINGDSTINFEVINSGSLSGTGLDWLVENKSNFTTYTVVRSYLGLARRDVKHFFRADNDYDKKKRLGHVIRGYIYARDIIDGVWDFDKANSEFKSIALDITTNKQLKEYDMKISSLRTVLTDKFNNKTLGLAQHMNVEGAKIITKLLLEFCNSDEFKNKQAILDGFNMDMFIDSFENWVEY